MKEKTPKIYGSYPDMDTVKEIVLYGQKMGQDKTQFIFHNFNDEIEKKTYNQVNHDYTGLGQYLYKIGMKDKKVAILSENSYYWIAFFYAVVTGKMTVVPIDPRLPADDIADIMVRSGCSAICYQKDFEDVIEVVKKTDGVVLEHYINIENFDALVEVGHADLKAGAKNYLDDEIDPDHLTFIVYTSGTTGKSKGVMLSQKNVASNVCASCHTMKSGHGLGFLPLHHTMSWASAVFPSCLLIEWGYICKSIRDLQKDLVEYSPREFAAVPLAIETIYKKIWYAAEKGGKAGELRKGLDLSRFLMKHGIDQRRRIFKSVVDSLGGDLEYIVCGGAYLDEKYEKGMYDFGIQIANGYGITECSPSVTVNSLDDFKFGSVGKPIACCEIKIDNPDESGVGEILVKGSNVMLGYYNEPETTAEAFDGDWFRTGDYGYIDEDGFLFYRGRKKNLIVLSNGKNVSPEEIEDKLSTIDYVKEVLVYDEAGYITAEFLLDTVSTPDAKARIKGDVNEINKKMPLYKQVARVKTRDTEFPKTTTLKIRRNYNK